MDPIHLTTTEAIDPVFMFIFTASALLLLGITATMIGFVIRYHRSRAPEPTSRVEGNLWLELLWIVLPSVLVLAMFYYGWAGYLALRNVPAGALEVTVKARMWSWSFLYANGKSSTELYVPVGQAVKVNLVSEDVIHGFYLPAFRVKRDVVPGMKNYAWFVASKAGKYDLFCSAYCGTGHSAMLGVVEAIPAPEFAAWLKQGQEEEENGHELLEKYGCLGCHSLDGAAKMGPTLLGIWGRRESIIRAGQEVEITVDEDYLRQAIREPKAELVKGFRSIMPSRSEISEGELTVMLQYLKGLK